MIILPLGGGPRASPTRWRAEAFTTITRATRPANNLPERAAEQEADHARPADAVSHDQTPTASSAIL
jgi:hypothetical protein